MYVQIEGLTGGLLIYIYIIRKQLKLSVSSSDTHTRRFEKQQQILLLRSILGEPNILKFFHPGAGNKATKF